MPDFELRGYCNLGPSEIATCCWSNEVVVELKSRRDDQQPLSFSADLFQGEKLVSSREQSAAASWHVSGLGPGTYRLDIHPATGASHHDYRHLALPDDFRRTLTLGVNDTVIVTGFVSRKESIIYDIPYQFLIETNDRADGGEPWYEISGFNAVTENAAAIATASSRFTVPERLIKSIMYMETTHGYYDKLISWSGQNASLLPMNVNVEYWSKLFTRSYLADNENNVLAGTFMLRRIMDRTRELKDNAARLQAIFSVYNSLNVTRTTDYAARVMQIYSQELYVPSPSFFEQLNEQLRRLEGLSPVEQAEMLRRLFGG